jgi:hypothetical protein
MGLISQLRRRTPHGHDRHGPRHTPTANGFAPPTPEERRVTGSLYDRNTTPAPTDASGFYGYSMLTSAIEHRGAELYACSAYHKRGTSICGNQLAMRIEQVDEAVLRTLGGDVLRPAVVMAVVDRVLDRISVPAPADDLGPLQDEQRAVSLEITSAIASGGDLPSLVDALKRRQARRDELSSALAIRSTALPRLDRSAIEGVVRERLADWRRLLTAHVEDGRQLLREVLAGL